MAEPKINCPAGRYVLSGDEGPCVLCAVEGNKLVPFLTNQRSVLLYCSGEYARCPSWRAEKDDELAARSAQGTEQTVQCPECEGDGAAILVGQRADGRLDTLGEVPCDVCRGTGSVSESVKIEEVSAINAMMRGEDA